MPTTSGTGDACTNACTLAVCGDGIPGPGEARDFTGQIVMFELPDCAETGRSRPAGTNQSNDPGVQTGHGEVVLPWQ